MTTKGSRINSLLLLGSAGAFLSAVTYFLGLWDRPKWEYRETLVVSSSSTSSSSSSSSSSSPTDVPKSLFVLVAPCQKLPFAEHIPRILEGTIEAIRTLDNADELLNAAASLYGGADSGNGENVGKVSVGLYFDDPKLVPDPRWAIGWAIAGDAASSLEKVQALAAKVNAASKLNETIVATRVGPGPVLAGRIPWRNALTPVIAPMLHWGNAYKAYMEGGYEVKGKDGTDGSLACELYVTGPKDSMEYIDYVVLMGRDDNMDVLDALFPVGSVVAEEEEEEEKRASSSGDGDGDGDGTALDN